MGNLRRAMAWIEGPSVTLDMLTPPVTMDAADWLAPLVPDSVDHSELQLAERLSFACLQAGLLDTTFPLALLFLRSTKHGSVDDSRYEYGEQTDTPRKCQPIVKQRLNNRQS